METIVILLIAVGLGQMLWDGISSALSWIGRGIVAVIHFILDMLLDDK